MKRPHSFKIGDEIMCIKTRVDKKQFFHVKQPEVGDICVVNKLDGNGHNFYIGIEEDKNYFYEHQNFIHVPKRDNWRKLLVFLYKEG